MAFIVQLGNYDWFLENKVGEVGQLFLGALQLPVTMLICGLGEQ